MAVPISPCVSGVSVVVVVVVVVGGGGGGGGGGVSKYQI